MVFKWNYEQHLYTHTLIPIINRFASTNEPLKKEQGRYTNDRRENRKCTLCDRNDIEDEFHFVLKCPFYSLLRKHYIKEYYCKKIKRF